MDHSKPRVVVCVPAFNEEATVGNIVFRCRSFVDEVLVCDDGSGDYTAWGAGRAGAKVITHKSNMGYGQALRDLFLESMRLGAEVVVTVDGDGQHDPSDIPKFVEAIDKGADVASGLRAGSVPNLRKLGAKVLDIASGSADSQCGFRAYRASRLAELLPSEMGMGAGSEIIKKARDRGMRIVEVPTIISYMGGTSTYNPFYHGLDVLFASFKQVSLKHPLISYGIPSLASFIIAATLWAWALTDFIHLGVLDLSIALVASFFTFVALSFFIIAVVLWVLISAVRMR